MRSRFRPARSPLSRNARRLVIGLLGVSTVIPVLLLSVRSDRLSKDHREVAEAVLQDYSALAANEFAQRLNRTLSSEKVIAAFRPFYQYSGAYIDHYNLPERRTLFVTEEDPAEASPGREQPSGSEDVEELIRRNAPYYLVRRYFYLDIVKAQLRIGEGVVAEADPLWEQRSEGDRVADAERAWLEQQVRKFAATDHEYYGERGLLFGRFEGQPRVYMCSLYTGPRSEEPSAGYGFEVQFEKLRDLFQECADLGPVLPGPLIQRVQDANPATITVRSPDGEVLFRTGEPVEGSRTAQRGLGPAFGDLVVEAALGPGVSDQLLSGGLPPSRRPEIWGLLTLSLILLGLTAAMMRRELILARLRSDFVASVSHELRTPLTQIRLFADTLLLGRFRTDEDRMRSLRIIDRETRRLDHLLENVLQFSRTERQEVQLAPEQQRLAPLVDEVLQSFEPMAQARRVSVVSKIGEVAEVLIDAEAFRRVLLNLLDNAVKYGPPGQTVRVELSGDDEAVCLTVDDEGEGIAPEHFPKIWQKYWRAHSAEKSAVAGTGIGLAVVKDLIARHGGTVEVASSPAGGARFVIELPPATENEKAAG